jgi:murein DD-endopeptidase MepM/ murein hydrolase activator NlpD
VHPNDDDLCKLRDGQIIRRGEKICREGNDGATGNHVHMAVGLGEIVGTGWQQNSKGRWVLVTTGGPIKPEDAFFVDPAFTTIRDAKGLNFKMLPQGKPAPGNYECTAGSLRIRSGTSTDKPVLGALKNRERVEIVKTKRGLDGAYWGRTSLGWVCMDYLKKVGG